MVQASEPSEEVHKASGPEGKERIKGIWSFLSQSIDLSMDGATYEYGVSTATGAQ